MIIVTGATGLVGGHLLWHLLQENERITAIRRESSNIELLRKIFGFYTSHPDDYLLRIDWEIGDVLDENSLLDILKNVSVIYHCAAIVSLGGSSDKLLDTNVKGTRNVVRATLECNIKKLCFVSSIAACGYNPNEGYIDEEGVWTDNTNRSYYARSKYYSEQEVWKGIKQGLNAVIVNPGVILGFSGTNTGSAQLFSQVRKGLMFYTNGGSGYVDVQDVARAMIELTTSDIRSERFVLVGENCSNKDILSLIADGFGKRRPFICIGKRLLWTIGLIAEILGKLFRFKPLIDRGTARSATHREFYSSKKIEQIISFQFTPIAKCIANVCRHMQQTELSEK